MLKPIQGALLRRQEDITSRSSVSTLVRQAVQGYLREMYPDAVQSVSVRYDPGEQTVVITTPSKALAGELSLNTREIRAHLATQQIKVSRIITR